MTRAIEKLGLPPNCPTCALLPIGWPHGKDGQPERRSVDTSLFYERWSDIAEARSRT